MPDAPAPLSYTPGRPDDPGASETTALDGMTFEALVARLDALSASLDDPALGLEDAVARYEAASEIARHALDRLRRAEARVQHLQLQ